MQCEHPIIMYKLPGINPATGKFFPPRSFRDIQDHPNGYVEVMVPCGKCFSCLKNSARDLTVRAYHEAKMHDYSCFVTLTVDDEHLEEVFPHGSLCHKPFQDFFKRLRKRSNCRLRYLMCAEYGETTARPHYHAIIFGLKRDFGSPVAIVKTDPLLGSSRSLYSGFARSEIVEQSWPYGHVYVGDTSPASIAYVAGYTLKAFTLGRDDKWYKSRGLLPEYRKWSRRPGLGSQWFVDNIHDLWRHEDLFEPELVDNSCLMNGHRLSIPRAYKSHMEYHLKKGDAPLSWQEKFDNISVSMRRQLDLAVESAEAQTRDDVDHALVELKNRLDKLKYLVATRKRL